MDVPQRTSLVNQVVEILRRDMMQGRLREHLPSESSLCERFQVSRVTLRAALDVLRRQRLIHVSHGRRTRIAAQTARRKQPSEGKVVAVLAEAPYHTLSPFSLFLISELGTHLQEAGYRLEFQTHSSNAFGDLEQLVARTRAACWVFLAVKTRVARWFSERGVPSLVVGYPLEEVQLPFLSTDYRATCRHAVGMLRARGHSRIALVVHKRGFSEHDPSVLGFSEALSLAEKVSIPPSNLIYHDGTVKGITAPLRRLFHSPAPPTGLLVVRAKYALTVLTHLIHSGVRVPQDASLISLNHEPFLDSVVPSVAHYEINWTRFAKQLYRMVMQTVGTGASPRRFLIMADFHDGETLAARR